MNTFTWNRAEVAPELARALDALSFAPVEGGASLRFTLRESGGVNVAREEEGFHIRYGTLADALRGVGLALAGREEEGSTPFQRFGMMLDCSRNAVMKVPYVKQWLRQLALLGYNYVMLYTEDTYQLPGEPFFGYKRGGYTLEEVREVDAYAASLGIEVVACIQTLGHLHQILKWDRYAPVRDTLGVLRVDAPETYELIGKMLTFWKEALGTRRIHIGMDEAHDMGRGKFLDKQGYEPQFDIFSRHLARVSALCEAHGLSPMIWSDMFFRMGNEAHSYYDRATVIPDAVREKIPANTQLVYWDYENKDKAFYREWICRHRELAGEPVMASGLWTWRRFWYDHATTEAAVRPCIEACREEKLSEVLFTLWGDGGSYCEFDSAWYGLIWAAELAYGADGAEDAVAASARAICNVDAELCRLGSGINIELGAQPVLLATLLWDDPLLGIGWEGFQREGGADKIRVGLEAVLRKIPASTCQLPDAGYLSALLKTALAKLALRERLVAAWEVKDRAALGEIANKDALAVCDAIAGLESAFRRQWLRRNKAFGMETTQIRFGAMQGRYRELTQRLNDYLAGEVETIEELDDRQDVGYHPVAYYYWLATGSAFF